MNGKALFMGLEYVGVDLIQEAEFGKFPVEDEKPEKKPRRLSRPLLLAALIALLLLLVGCAAVCATLIFGSPKEMISALYGENAGFASAPPTEASDPWRPDSVWTVPGYERQPVEQTVSRELEKWVTPVGQSIASHGNKLTVDAFIYDSVTQSGLITMLFEHSEPIDLMLGYNGEIAAYLLDINQYGRAYLIPEKTTDTQFAFTWYFRMDKLNGDNLSITFPDYEEVAKSEALEEMRKEEVPKIRQRLMKELTVEEAAQKCRELYGFSGLPGDYDDYYFLAAYEFDAAHEEERQTQYGNDMEAIEQSLKEELTPEEAIAQLKELGGEELWEETMFGNSQADRESLAYFILAARIYDQTHTENKIFVHLPEDMALPNQTFGGGAVLVNTLCVRVSSSLQDEDGRSPRELILHMKDGSDFIVRNEVTENVLFCRSIEHDDTLYMLNSAVNIDNIQSVELVTNQSGVTLEADD